MKVSKCFGTDVTIQHQLSPADGLDAMHVLLHLKFVTVITTTVNISTIPTLTGSLRAEPVLKQVLTTTSVFVYHVMVAVNNRNVISAPTLRVTASYAPQFSTDISLVYDSENSLGLRAPAHLICAPPVRATTVLILNLGPRSLCQTASCMNFSLHMIMP